MAHYDLTLPLDEKTRLALKAGDTVRLSGTMYTARDAAHKRITEALSDGRELPVPLKDSAVYYCGPTPARPGEVIGSCGPTTSARMDAYAPALIAAGSTVMIGKGKRAPAVVEAMQKYGAVYFAAVGGAAAVIKDAVKACECAAYPDLGCEAVYRLRVENFAAIVAIDAHGGTILR